MLRFDSPIGDSFFVAPKMHPNPKNSKILLCIRWDHNLLIVNIENVKLTLHNYENHCFIWKYTQKLWLVSHVPNKYVAKGIRNYIIFLVEFSGNIGRNSFLTSIVSQKIFRPYFQKSRTGFSTLLLFLFC